MVALELNVPLPVLADIDVDLATARAVYEAVGSARHPALLALMCERMDRLADPWPCGVPDDEQLKRQLHQYRGSAATLGLRGLVHCLATLEATLDRADNECSQWPESARAGFLGDLRAAQQGCRLVCAALPGLIRGAETLGTPDHWRGA